MKNTMKWRVGVIVAALGICGLHGGALASDFSFNDAPGFEQSIGDILDDLSPQNRAEMLGLLVDPTRDSQGEMINQFVRSCQLYPRNPNCQVSDQIWSQNELFSQPGMLSDSVGFVGKEIPVGAFYPAYCAPTSISVSPRAFRVVVAENAIGFVNRHYADVNVSLMIDDALVEFSLQPNEIRTIDILGETEVLGMLSQGHGETFVTGKIYSINFVVDAYTIAEME